MGKSFVVFLVFFLVLAGGIWLQVFLSKKENKWYGLILPFICLAFSLIAVLGNMMFLTVGEVSMQQLAPDGTVIEETVEVQDMGGSLEIGARIVPMVFIFALYNIPTAILLVIYFACREKMKKHSALDKMHIQDLE